MWCRVDRSTYGVLDGADGVSRSLVGVVRGAGGGATAGGLLDHDPHLQDGRMVVKRRGGERAVHAYM